MSGYFDHNATTPLCPAAREAWLGASDTRWHNPSSLYRAAGEANSALNDARQELADFLDCDPERVLFNSGATEGNHSLFAWLAERRPETAVAVSGVEHPSVREPARRFFPGEACREIPVDSDGRVRIDALEGMLDGVSLVSVMAAGNETGVLQPWSEIGALCRAGGVRFHCDATQWIGKLPVAGMAGACDYLTASAHKFGGPKGCGFLVIGSGDESYGGQVGGPQEFRRRAGTQNLPGVEAMLAALAWAESERELRAASVADARDRFEHAVCAAIPECRVISAGAERLWNTSMLAMPEGEHVRWLTRIDRLGYRISTGSACSSGNEGPSLTLQAMGVDPATMNRVLRVSAGWETRDEDWQGLLAAFEAVHADLSSPARRRAGHGIAADPTRL